MKNLFKNPFFYINIFLLVLLILLSASINPNSTNLPSFAKKALAAVQSILGEGTVNYLAAFTGANQIGNSIIYDTGTNVGIGTTNPSQKLDVGSGNVSANDYWIQTAKSGVGIWASQMGGAGGSGIANYVSKWTGGTSLGNSQIVDNGNSVSLKGDNGGNLFTISNSSNGGSAFAASASNVAGTGIRASGNRGISAIGSHTGVDSLGKSIGVFGQTYNASPYSWPGGSFGIGVAGAGTSYDFYAIGSGVNYGSASSIRWKENITVIDNPLNKINQLRGVYFDWKKDKGGKHDIGMIAEEVMKVLPEIVQRDPDNPEYADGMDYSKLTPLLVEAVKELKTENEVLRWRVEALEIQLNAGQ